MLNVLTLLGSASCFAGLGPWNYTSSLNVARFYNVAVLSRSTIVYIFGGYPYTNTPYPVECATVQPGGTLSPWVIESSQMVDARQSPVSFATDSYVYAIGGDVNLPGCVERAPINYDGSLGLWTTISILPQNFTLSGLIKYNQYIYVISGYQEAGVAVLPYIYRTTVNANGSLGTWTQLSSQLLVGREGLSSILINTTVYVVGGANGAGFDMYSVEKATIFPDGQFSAFTTVTSTLEPHTDGDGLFYDGTYLNALSGGFQSERAQINPDGSLGNWAQTSGLQMDIGGYGFLQTSSAAYVIGGYNGNDSNTVEYAPLVPTGIEKREWEIFD